MTASTDASLIATNPDLTATNPDLIATNPRRIEHKTLRSVQLACATMQVFA
jgi:hypothetical protein